MQTLRLIAVVAILLIPSSWAKAYSGEALYKSCLPYTQNGFVTDTLGTVECVVYIRGVLDAATQNCDSLKGEVFIDLIGKVDGANLLFEVFSSLHFAKEPPSFSALVQKVVNNLRDNPESWQFNAAHTIAKAASELAPCE